MKKHLGMLFFTLTLLFGNNVKANEYDFDFYGISPSGVNPPGTDLSTFQSPQSRPTGFANDAHLYSINSKTKEATIMSLYTPTFVNGTWQDYFIDPRTKKLFFWGGRAESSIDSVHVFDPTTKEWSTTCSDTSSFDYSDLCQYKVPTGFEWDSSASTSISVGKKDDPTIINENGISGIITKDPTTGITKIGENSLNFKESSGPLELWGTNTTGKIVPINIKSKLLINGRDVEQSINNVGALSAALTGLPTVPTETTLACGLGTGTHGGDFAFSGGCASKVNEKLSINYAASMTMPGQDYAGDFEDTISARAGFVWKLGKSLKPTQISLGEKEKMEVKIDSLEDKNKKLENTVSTLIAKLERLEKIALSETKSKVLATIKLP